MDATVKKIPYGMTDFERIIRDNYYYVDKSAYIAEVENSAPYFFFVRPRRFGKTLFLSMLEWYYDRNKQDRFDEIFGGLEIAKRLTPDRGKYLVLRFNFSNVSGKLEQLEDNFNAYCKTMISSFAKVNACWLGDEALKKLEGMPTAASLLSSLCQSAQDKHQKIYLILDEYDNFANNIWVDYGTERYRNVTHGDGFFRGFLKVIKGYTENVIEHIFLTGVSPVTMDDLTSGFNIAANYSQDSQFNNMMGFNEQEVREMLDYYQGRMELPHTTDELVGIMRPWYDNYCFSKDAFGEPPLYNSDMVLYFMSYYLRKKKVPENMLDSNIRTDYNKLRHLIQLDKTFGGNASVVQEILEEGYTFGIIADSFPAMDIAKPKNFKSLLYYYGMLTIGGVEMDDPLLTVPNQTVREQLYGYMADIYKDTAGIALDVDELNRLMSRMAYKGEWQAYFRYIAEQLESQSSIREFIEGEAHVKAFFLAYLGLNSFYLTRPEYETDKGYADLFLQPRLWQRPNLAYSYCIEVKYARRDADDAVLDRLTEEAKEQLARYASGREVQQDKGTTQLTNIVLVFRGWQLERVVEA